MLGLTRFLPNPKSMSDTTRHERIRNTCIVENFLECFRQAKDCAGAVGSGA
jgi:hypothetical protein